MHFEKKIMFTDKTTCQQTFTTNNEEIDNVANIEYLGCKWLQWRLFK